MAYSIKSNVIINDVRELIGVNTAGINTALYVGENIQLDATTGIITASEAEFKGDLNITNNGNLIIGAGGSITAEGIFLEIDGENVGVATIAPGGDVSFTNIDASGYVQVGAGLTANGSFRFGAGAEVTAITTDLSVSALATDLPTAQSVTTYVDAAVGDAGTLDFVDENGVLGQVNIGAGSTLGILGTDNEIVTQVPVGLGTEIQFGLSSELILPGSVAVTGLATFNANVDYATGVQFAFADDGNAVNAIGVSSALAEDAAAETRLVSEKAIKQFVDGVQSSVEANANLRIEDAAGGIGTVALGTENLVFNGVANETLVEVSGAPGSLTVGLATDVTIAGSITVTDNFQFDGGQTVDTIGIATDLGDASAADTVLPTQLAVKTYVDSQIGAANQLNFEGDAGGQLEIELDSETLQLFGTAEEIETVGAGNSMTFGLPEEVQVTTSMAVGLSLRSGNLTVGNGTLNTISNDVFEMKSVGGNSIIENKSNQDTFKFQYDNLGIPADQLVLDHSTASAPFASLTGRLDVSAGAVITGVCTATDFNSTSDINKKENIVEIADALEKVEALRGVTFDWKDGTGKSGGIIAQDVQAVLPEIVKEGEHLTVNYNGLTGLLIEAVKELSARVAELEANN